MNKLARPTPEEDVQIATGIAADPDTWEASAAELKTAFRGRPPLPAELRKKQVTIMLDRDVIEHFRSGGKGWQTRVNQALRKAMG